jgi:hypothetical protein
MKTIHIKRLNLRCRGIPPATARAALAELGGALRRQLADSGDVPEDNAAGSTSATLRVSSRVSATALAAAAAALVAVAIRAGAPLTLQNRKSKI